MFRLELGNSNVLVVGLGRSGMAACRFLREHGSRVAASDAQSEQQLGSVIAELKASGVTIRAGESRPGAAGFDLLVISPGVPSDAPVVLQARELGVPVIGELELA
ncbi:MAG: UDP-N-acetylmuramoyl-L-alanine--D-glutamate ligase, partial [Acidobacteria bacterium]|nr:UDP-N-acetylmuramoyl-L-alanine--D-glutamate ligase [Acidobacteriota bacterium]